MDDEAEPLVRAESQIEYQNGEICKYDGAAE